MRKNLQNLINCPGEGVAVKEVKTVEGKKSINESIVKNMNSMISDNIEGRLPNGNPTVNRTEATTALYKIADRIVEGGQSMYTNTKCLVKMKPKVAKGFWKSICIIKGYPMSGLEDMLCSLMSLHDAYVLSGMNWKEDSVSDLLNNTVLPNLDDESEIIKVLEDLFTCFSRLARSEGLCTHAEWLVEAITYLYKDTNNCLVTGLEDLVEPVLKYKFSMGTVIERALVIQLNRIFRRKDNIKNTSLVSSILKINNTTDRMLHIQPSSRDLHEVYIMPYSDKAGSYKLDYIALRTLESYVEQGETLENYYKVCINKGTIPESVIITLVENINRNRLAVGLTRLDLVKNRKDNEGEKN